MQRCRYILPGLKRKAAERQIALQDGGLKMSPTRALLVLCPVLGLALAGCDSGAAPTSDAAPPPPSVVVAEVRAEAVPLHFQYAGRIAAFREVEVRARIQGILQAKTFIEGSRVKQGDVLFRIDPAPYEAELARARASRQQAQAQVARTERDLERAVTLFQRNVGTEKARDDALSARDLARAALAGAEAQVKTAEINLGYTTITAPIAGVTSLRVLPEGSLVNATTNSLLTRITQLDPVYVHFSFTDTEAREIRRLLDSGQGFGPPGGRLKVRISFGDGQRYDREGEVDFTDSNLDLQTGTLRARAVLANPQDRLRPGEFVRVSVEGVTRRDAIVVPQAAVMQGPQGQFVYALEAGDKAVVRPITIGREVGKGWIVEKGLEAGERIVTEGVVKVKPGSPVAIAKVGATAQADAAPQ
jgi:membrane fusion protein (multidrug efflux system)